MAISEISDWNLSLWQHTPLLPSTQRICQQKPFRQIRGTYGVMLTNPIAKSGEVAPEELIGRLARAVLDCSVATAPDALRPLALAEATSHVALFTFSSERVSQIAAALRELARSWAVSLI